MSNTDGEDTQRTEVFFEIPSIEFYYGDKKELPVCLMREIHENMFYWSSHLHPNQKYETDKFDQSRRATETALKYVKELASLREQLKQQEEVIRELIPIAQECIFHREYPNSERFSNPINTNDYKAIIEKAKSLTTKDK